MNPIRTFIIIAGLAFLTACNTTPKAKVNFDKNEKVSTANYKTFTWLTDEKIMSAPVGFNQVMKIRIDEAIEEAFVAKGYQKVASSDDADFTISYTVGSRDKVRVDSFPSVYRSNIYWGRGYWGWHGYSQVTHEQRVQNYQEGKLAIDVFDVETKQPAWHGWGAKRILKSDKNDPATAVKAIVEQVVAQFN